MPNGIRIRFGDVVFDILSANGLPLEADQFSHTALFDLWYVDIIQALPQAPVMGGEGNETLHGTTKNDTLVGMGDIDILIGHEGNDMLSGGDVNDLLFGGASVDALNGGAGNDTVNYSDTAGAIVVNLA